MYWDVPAGFQTPCAMHWRTYEVERIGLINDIEIKYSVGALQYTPALNRKIADAVIGGRIEAPYSLALCLEDTIGDEMVELAEAQVCETLQHIWQAVQTRQFYLPFTGTGRAAVSAYS